MQMWLAVMKRFVILSFAFLLCFHVNAKKDYETAVKGIAAMYRLPYKTEGIIIDSCMITEYAIVYKCRVDVNSKQYRCWDRLQRQAQIRDSKKSIRQKRLEMIDRINRSFLYEDKYLLLYKAFRKAYIDSVKTYVQGNRLGKYLVDRMTIYFVIYKSKKDESTDKCLCAFSLDMNDIDSEFVKEYEYKQFFIPKK